MQFRFKALSDAMTKKHHYIRIYEYLFTSIILYCVYIPKMYLCSRTIYIHLTGGRGILTQSIWGPMMFFYVWNLHISIYTYIYVQHHQVICRTSFKRAAGWHPFEFLCIRARMEGKIIISIANIVFRKRLVLSNIVWPVCFIKNKTLYNWLMCN